MISFPWVLLSNTSMLFTVTQTHMITCKVIQILKLINSGYEFHLLSGMLKLNFISQIKFYLSNFNPMGKIWKIRMWNMTGKNVFVLFCRKQLFCLSPGRVSLINLQKTITKILCYKIAIPITFPLSINYASSDL